MFYTQIRQIYCMPNFPAMQYYGFLSLMFNQIVKELVDMEDQWSHLELDNNLAKCFDFEYCIGL